MLFKTKTRPGQTLVEVVVATIIAAITTTAVFSVILSSFVSDAKGDKRDAAAMVLKRASETLKSYVSAQPSDANYVAGSPVGHWAAATGNAWSLSAGNHTITSLLTGTPLNLPGASFTYTVTNYNCVGLAAAALTNFNQCKAVTFTLVYPD